MTVEDIFQKRGAVAVRWSASGSHQGYLGKIRPTGKPLNLSGTFSCKMTGGKIIESWGEWGALGLMQQLGVSTSDFLETVAADLNQKKPKIELRRIGPSEGVPLLLLAPGPPPGWRALRHAGKKIVLGGRPVIHTELLATRFIVEKGSVLNGHDVRTEVQALKNSLDSVPEQFPIDVLAYSSSGNIAVRFAIEYPRYVRSLILVEPAMPWILEDQLAPSIIDYKNMLPNQFNGSVTIQQFIDFYKKTGVLKEGINPRKIEFWPRFSPYRQFLKVLPAFRDDRQGRISALSGLKMPVLLMKTDQSDAAYGKIVDELARHIQQAQISSWPGGHNLFAVEQSPMIPKILEFCKGLDSRRQKPSPRKH